MFLRFPANMKEEAKRWMEQAQRDLGAAKSLFKAKQYNYTSFWCQQAIEKALKALLLKKNNTLVRTHDLLFLGRKVNLPENLIEICKNIGPVYIETRYPDAEGKFISYSKNDAENDLKMTGEILLWIEKEL